jgi:hypothetical protein
MMFFLQTRGGPYKYKAASQNITANGRYVESGRSRVWKKGPLFAQSGRNVAVQRTALSGTYPTFASCSALALKC